VKGRSRPVGGGPEPKAHSEDYHSLRSGTALPFAVTENLALAGKDVGRPGGRPTSADGNAETAATRSLADRREHRNAFRAGGGCRSLATARVAVAGGGAAGATGTVTAPLAVAWTAPSRPRLSSPLREARPQALASHLTALTSRHTPRHTPSPSLLAIRVDLRSHVTEGSDQG